jgi:hypothetical protein
MNLNIPEYSGLRFLTRINLFFLYVILVIIFLFRFLVSQDFYSFLCFKIINPVGITIVFEASGRLFLLW